MFINRHFNKCEEKIDAKLKLYMPWYGEEKDVSFGRENPDKTFLAIRRNDRCGLGSYIVTNIRYIDRALKNNMIPVIDMKNYDNAYHTNSTIGKENVWEYYFEQPYIQYGLADIYKSQHVHLTNIRILPPKNGEPDFTMDFFDNADAINHFRKIAHDYIRLNEKTSTLINEQYKKIIDSDDYVLGVVLRGTDYTWSKPKNHPIQPSIEEVIRKCKEVMREKGCNKIFLATEDKAIFKSFINEFESRCVTNDKMFVDYTGGGINGYTFDRPNDGYLRGMEYLTTMTILSKCDCLVAGRCGASVVATIMSERYDYSYYYDLGVY